MKKNSELWTWTTNRKLSNQDVQNPLDTTPLDIYDMLQDIQERLIKLEKMNEPTESVKIKSDVPNFDIENNMR
jgi:hypothetical protein